MRKKTIVILYSEALKKDFISEEEYKTEAEVYPRAKSIKPYLEKLGYKVMLLPGNKETFYKLKRIKPYLVFNLVDSIFGKEDLAAVVPSMLELLKIPYTGADFEGQILNSDKQLTKLILKEAKIPVPNFQLLNSLDFKLDKKLRFPIIVKLNKFHGSVAINDSSVVENMLELEKRLKFLFKKYNQQILLEEFIDGKEITVLQIDDKKRQIVLAEERIFMKKKKYLVFGYDEAWGDKELYDCINFYLNEEIKKDIRRAFKVLKMKDYGRFELRFDNHGNHYVIDANTNPSIGPYGSTSGPFGYLLHINKINFADVLKIIIKNTCQRFNS